MDISQVIAIVALVVSALGFLSNTRKDTRADAAALATIETKLNTLLTSVNEIRVDNKSLRNEIIKHGEQIVKLEARMDALEGHKKEG